MKSDYLKECMTGFDRTPIDVFNNSYCRVCINPQCSRSSAGSAFNKRVNDWESRLFLNVPRADGKDPKFDHIRSKHFISPSADPLIINSIPEPVRTIEPMITFTEEKLDEPKTEIIEKIESPSEVAPVQSLPQPESLPKPSPLNTPFNQSVILPSRPSEISMEPGSTYVFGDNSNE